MKRLFKALGLAIGISMPVLAAPTSGPAGNFILNISTNVNVQIAKVSSETITTQLSLPYLTPGQCQTTNSAGQVIGVACGGGAATIAFTTGTSSGFNTVISSPTGVGLFNGSQFLVTQQGSATAYFVLNPSSVTLQGNTITFAILSVSTASLASSIATLSASTTSLQANFPVSMSTNTTGVLPIANGGTGTSSPGLIAGTNITSITGSWPNQTINAATQSGGGGGGGGAGVIAGTGNIFQTPYVSIQSSNTLQMSGDLMQYPSSAAITVPIFVTTMTVMSSMTINGNCLGYGCENLTVNGQAAFSGYNVDIGYGQQAENLNLDGSSPIAFYDAINDLPPAYMYSPLAFASSVEIDGAGGVGINRRPSIAWDLTLSSMNAGSYVQTATLFDTHLANNQCVQTDGSHQLISTGGSCGGGGGSSSLQVTNSGVQVTSPTASVNFYGGDFLANAIGSTTSQILLNPATTDYVHNTSSLQSGATFYVSSGTVAGQLNLNNVVINGTCTGAGCGSGSGGGIVSPGTFTWTNAYGIGVTTATVQTTTPTIVSNPTGANLNSAGWVVVKQHYAFETAFSGNSLTVFDVANPTSPVLLSQIAQATGGSLYGAEGLEISGNYLFQVSLTTSTFNVWDISSPANIKAVYSVEDTTNFNGAEAIRIYGNYAYVANYSSTAGSQPGITVVDISNPVSPKIIGKLINSNIIHPIYMQIKYPYLYEANEDTSCDLNIIDISNPTNPVLKTSFVPSGCTGTALGGDFNGRYYYMGGHGNSAIYTIDISSPLAPVSVATTTTGAYAPGTLRVLGNKLYATSILPDGILQFDLANPANPVWVSTTTTGISRPDDLFSNGQYLYATDHGSGGSTGGLTLINTGSAYISALQAGSAQFDEVEVTHDLRVNREFLDTSLSVPMIGAQLASISTVTFSSATVSTALNLPALSGQNCLGTSASGVVQAGTCTGSGSGIVSPATFTWRNNYGMSFSTISVSSNTILPNTTIYADGTTISGGNIQMNGAVGIGMTGALGSGTLEVNGEVLSNTSFNSNIFTGGYFIQGQHALPALVMNSNSTYGVIENDNYNGDVFDLGYGASATSLGTPVLQWSKANQVIGPSASFVATPSSFSVNSQLVLSSTVISGGTAGTGVQVLTSSGTAGPPYWATFSGGSGITALTGDVTASGSGSVAATAAATQPNIAILSHAVTHTSSVTVTAAGGVGVTYSVTAGSVSVNALLISTTAITGNFTLTSTTTVVMANCASACTMTLPTAVGISGEIFNIKIIGAGVVTINTTSAQTIDGSTSIVPNPNKYASIEVISDGSNYEIL